MVDDELLGEKMVVFVSTNTTLTKEIIFQNCMKKLQSHEMPSEIILLDDLPKNQSSKVDYAKLKKDHLLIKKDD